MTNLNRHDNECGHSKVRSTLQKADLLALQERPYHDKMPQTIRRRLLARPPAWDPNCQCTRQPRNTTRGLVDQGPDRLQRGAAAWAD
eukprot:9500005-Pyramimonas_sp.AAC.1